jgi:putative ABC transport system permease protein
MKVVVKSFLRYLIRRRALSFLQLLGIACGVAAAVGMFFSSQTALSNFSNTVSFLNGNTTHTIQRPAGPLGEEILIDIFGHPSVEAFSPVIDRRILLNTGNLVRIMGLDIFLDKDIRSEFGALSLFTEQSQEKTLSFLTEARTILLDSRLAERLDLREGDELETNRGALKVTGTFSNPAGEPLILMDIGHLQEIFGLRGKIDRVDLILSDDESFQTRFNKGFLIQSNTQRQSSLSNMFRAFRLNLEALSLLALFVGVFLIYNTATFAVVSRRKDAGVLRALGARKSEIVLAFLLEIVALGAVGGCLGGLLGYFLSYFFTSLLSKTISNLYFFLNASSPVWSWRVLPYGILIGSVASVLGALFPLADLVREDPVRALRGRYANRAWTTITVRAALAGLAVCILSAGLFASASKHVYAGFAGAFFLLLGTSLLTGLLMVMVVPALSKLFEGFSGITGKIAATNITRNLGRTAVAIAAFMVALSMLIGLGSMIGSFRSSLVWWMNCQLKGDFYISSQGIMPIPEPLYEELKTVDGIAGVDTYRNLPIAYRDTTVNISMVDASVLQKFSQFAWLAGGNENWNPVKQGAVIVSESFYNRFGLGAADTISLNGIEGPQKVTIAAVFYDYTTEHGLIMMDRSTYRALFGDYTIDSLAIFLDPNANRETVIETIKQKTRKWEIPIINQKELHDGILEVFDTTFALTRSMRFLAIVVAFFGIAGALLTLFLERQREFGIYRALGFSTRQVAGITVMEGVGMGIISFILSIFVGTLLAWVLIKIINFQSFNWTIFYHFSLSHYSLAAATAIVASLGASLYPILKICRTYPQIQIREE